MYKLFQRVNLQSKKFKGSYNFTNLPTSSLIFASQYELCTNVKMCIQTYTNNQKIDPNNWTGNDEVGGNLVISSQLIVIKKIIKNWEGANEICNGFQSNIKSAF